MGTDVRRVDVEAVSDAVSVLEDSKPETLSLIEKLRDSGFLVFEKTIRRAWYEKEE